MNGSVNHPHYLPTNLTKHELKILQRKIDAGELDGPMFVGQGLSYGIGSDCYGYYITAMKKVGRKVVWGITRAKTEVHVHWTEGTEDCSIDMETAVPTEWIVARGKWPKTGRPKWWYCDENGNRFLPGRKARFRWNGAHSYRDPSF